MKILIAFLFFVLCALVGFTLVRNHPLITFNTTYTEQTVVCPEGRAAKTSMERVGCLLKMQNEKIGDLTDRLVTMEDQFYEEESTLTCVAPPSPSPDETSDMCCANGVKDAAE